VNKLIFATDRVASNAVGGREQLSRILGRALADIYGDQFEIFELSKGTGMAGASIRERLNGHIDGASPQNIASLIEMVRRLKADQVLLNGSNLGRVAQGLRTTFPGIEISTFFHNCEARFFWGALRQSPSLRALGVLVANYRAERLAVKISDKLICLNQRDSQQLQRIYGRCGTHILPMAMDDQLPKDLPAAPQPQRERYALFVGGTFYANRQGIEWFVEHVATKSPIKTYVVGKGFEEWKVKLERNGNVEVVGSVDSLVPWYLGAHVVIAPIFDGSGMKTKVAEALMFGKRIVGTPEAFSGYEDIADQVGWRCATADEFVDAISRGQREIELGFDPQLRALYEERYSLPAAKERLAKILGCSSTDS
jgi:polysaccharide biosynthesis protein PslH